MKATLQIDTMEWDKFMETIFLLSPKQRANFNDILTNPEKFYQFYHVMGFCYKVVLTPFAEKILSSLTTSLA